MFPFLSRGDREASKAKSEVQMHSSAVNGNIRERFTGCWRSALLFLLCDRSLESNQLRDSNQLGR
jgi:hypothetical protein